MWPSPAAFADYFELALEVSSPDGVPTWEVYRKKVELPRELLASGTADTIGAAKAAAIFEAETISQG
jgi:hypothetical protein